MSVTVGIKKWEVHLALSFGYAKEYNSEQKIALKVRKCAYIENENT